MPEMIKVAGLFALTALAEIVGCYLPWLVLRDARTPWLLLPAAASLAAFAWLLTLHPTAAGRTYAAYGGMYIVVALLWLKLVDGIDAAIAHIHNHGSHHTDAIVTDDEAVAERFLREVDSAIVLVNASTQFADGGEFGMGAEIGISTQRLPPRGPVGPAELTTYKSLVRGNGQVRP